MVELVFSRVGKITGARIHVFLLEHSRVVRQIRWTFHIFRYVLAGESKYEMKLRDETAVNLFAICQKSTKSQILKKKPLNICLM